MDLLPADTLYPSPATDLYQPFLVHDFDHYHIAAAFDLAGGVMQITRVDVYGWRLTSVLPFVWSVPAVYVLGNWLAGRTAAWLCCQCLFAGAHVLLTFSPWSRKISPCRS